MGALHGVSMEYAVVRLEHKQGSVSVVGGIPKVGTGIAVLTTRRTGRSYLRHWPHDSSTPQQILNRR